MAGCCVIFQRWLSLFLYAMGIGLSSFAYYVELKKSADEEYVALCDIGEGMSCSKVFNSKYGKGFGLVALGMFNLIFTNSIKVQLLSFILRLFQIFDWFVKFTRFIGFIVIIYYVKTRKLNV